MKTQLPLLLIACCLSSCEDNPDICLEGKPIPVIYSVFSKYDSVNYIYITKTWSGDNGGSQVKFTFGQLQSALNLQFFASQVQIREMVILSCRIGLS